MSRYPGAYTRRFRVGSITSGIASERVAIENAHLPWTHSFFAENAAFPSALLAHHYPETPNFGDITRAGIEEDIRRADVDLLVASTPCQSFSNAGLRGGLADPRGQLTLRFAEICAHAQPEWIVWENVPGAFTADRGEAFRQLLAALDVLGYHLAWRVFDAQHFGLAQRRKRVFVVGHLRDAARPRAVLLEPDRLCWDPEPRRTTRSEVAGTLEARARTGGSRPGLDAHGAASGHLQIAGALSASDGGPDDNDARQGRLVSDTLGTRVRGVGDLALPVIAAPLTTRPYADTAAAESRLVAHALNTSQQRNDASVETFVIPFDSTQITHPENRSLCLPGSPAHALASDAHPPAVAFNIFPVSGQGTDLHAKETDVANALLVTDLASMTDRGTRVAQRGVRRLTLLGDPNGTTAEANTAEELLALRRAVGSEAMVEWGLGVVAALRSPKVLRSRVLSESSGRAPHDGHRVGDDALPRAEARTEGPVQCLWEAACVGRPPPRWEPSEQLARELAARLSRVSHEDASHTEFLCSLWVASEGLEALREALPAFQETRATRGVRRLTPLECERLMGYPDGYTLLPASAYAPKKFKGDEVEEMIRYLSQLPHFDVNEARRLGVTPDGVRYAALGNSIATNVLAWIFQRIEEQRVR